MDFIHCLLCYTLPDGSKYSKFILTSCGHIFCTNCSSSTESECKYCKSQCKIMALTNDLPASVIPYFANKNKEFNLVTKTLLAYQRPIKLLLDEYIPKLKTEVNVLKQKCELYERTIKEKERENLNLKKLLANSSVKERPRKDSGCILSNTSSEGPAINSSNFFKARKSNCFGMKYASSQSTDSPISQPQGMRMTMNLTKNKSTFRDQFRMLNPPSSQSRIIPTFNMTPKPLPKFNYKSSEESSPSNYSTPSSVKSTFSGTQKSYFPPRKFN